MSDYIRAIRERIGTDLLVVPAAGTLIFDSDQRLLLVRHSEGVWTNPGGLVEPFESAADTAVRETWEEIGVLVELTGLIGVFGGPDHYIKYRNGDEIAFVATLFEARILEGAPVADGNEVFEVKYFSRKEALHLELTSQKRRHLEVGFERRASAYFDQPAWAPSRHDG